jgi:hypothetical protein
MAVVAVGDLPLEAILAAFQGMGTPTGAGESPAQSAAPSPEPEHPGAGPRTVRAWQGGVRTLGSTHDPHALVVARLLADDLRVLPSPAELEVELWDEGRVAALVLTGSAPAVEAETLAESVRRFLEALGDGWNEGRISAAVEEARLSLLLEAGTPAGLARVVGRHLDATGDPSGAHHYARGLERITAESMGIFLTGVGRPHFVGLEGGR